MKFRLGIVMAGAVSAGAYTAGVIDYLLEALDRWEKAKQKNREYGKTDERYDHSLPMHDVVIEVMGGASAGGMTAAIATLALFKGIKPVRERHPAKGDNLVYDAWVNLNDNEIDTMQQLLATNDLENPSNKGVPSLLNADAISKVGQNAKNSLLEAKDMTDWQSTLPPYVSPEMDIILSLCSLRGIPVDVQFETDSSIEPVEVRRQKIHRMWIHKWNAHFKLSDEKKDFNKDYALAFNPSKQVHLSNLVNCAIASGAFPFGLKPVKVESSLDQSEKTIIKPPSSDYLKAQINRLFKENKNVTPHIEDKNEQFVSTIVDGGVVNNEPFGEVERILEELEQVNTNEYTNELKETDLADYHALLMIDPFPSNAGKEEPTYKHPLSVEKLLGPLFSAVRRQAMVKESDIPKCFSLNTTRSLVIPTNENNKEYPIACGSLGGFGGFFSKEFREHDFFLGRKNCQSFLRKHFSIDADFLAKDEHLPEEKRLFGAYSNCLAGNNQEMYLRFAYSEEELEEYNNTYAYGEEGSETNNTYNAQKTTPIRYPIIPDTLLTKASSKDKAYWDEKENKDQAEKIPEALKSPKVSIEELQALRKPMKTRIKGIMNNYIPGINSLRKSKNPKSEALPNPSEEIHKAAVKKIVKKHFLGNDRMLIWGGAILLLFMFVLPLLWQFVFESEVKSALLVILYAVLFCVALFGILFYLLKNMAVSFLTKNIFSAIVSDFKKRNLLEE